MIMNKKTKRLRGTKRQKCNNGPESFLFGSPFPVVVVVVIMTPFKRDGSDATVEQTEWSERVFNQASSTNPLLPASSCVI